jgi:hypothetical protein
VVEEQREARRRAEANAAESLAGERAAWEAREHRRQAIRSTAMSAMSSALGDLSVTDHDPGASPDENRLGAARRRLEALAERGSELFTDDVVDHIFELVGAHGHIVLLGVLRRLALNQPVRRAPVAALAVDVLAERASLPAAACLVDLRDQVVASSLTESVIRSLVLLAGRPERDDFGHRKTRAANNDPAGLRVAADLRPDLVEATIRDLLTVTPSQRIDWDALVMQANEAGFEVVRDRKRTEYGYCDMLKKEIGVRPDVEGAQAVKTLIHELAHALLHSDATVRDRDREEVEVESVAFVVLDALGLASDDYSFPYVARWANGDVEILRQTAERVVSCASRILGGLQENNVIVNA